MTSDYEAQRLNMVEGQVRTSDVTDIRIQEAMRAIPREGLAAGKAHLAYADMPVEYAPGRHMMRPRDVSRLVQALRPQAGERALAIAAPYGAQVLEALGLSVERFDGEDLAAVPAGPYDVIVTEGAAARAPESWRAALAVGGRLGCVERDGPMGRAMLYVRSDAGVSGRAIFDSAQPYLPGLEPQYGFTF